MFENFDDVLNIDELSRALKTCKNNVYSLVRTGEIKSFRIGKVYKIPKANVIEYIKNKEL